MFASFIGKAIAEILKQDEQIEIVVIDRMEKAERDQYTDSLCHGKCHARKVLRQANVQQAKAVLIFADDLMWEWIRFRSSVSG